MPDAPITSSTASAWRVRFLEEAPAGLKAIAEFNDPGRRVAVSEAIDVQMLPKVGAWPEPVDELCVWFLPSGATTPIEEQRRAEAWMARPDRADAVPTIDLVMRSDRILWRPGRAVILGATDRLDENLRGLVDFAFHEGELRRLEREVASGWPRVEADAHLTHSVDATDLPASARVDEMTKATTLRRMRFARLEPHIDKASMSLPGPARRLVSELCVQMETLDRLKALDDRIEVFEDLYEGANDRLSEFRYFHREDRVEWLIVWLLVVENLLMVWELLRRS